MTSQAENDLWSRMYSSSGPQSLDKALNGASPWNEVIQTGEADLALGLRFTTITFGIDRSALDLGCGAGRLTHVLGRRFGRVLGVDTSTGMIREANKRRCLDNIGFLLTDDRLSLPENVGLFDTVFSYEVFHYLTARQLQHYFEVIFCRLKPGGEFVFQLNVEPIRPVTQISFTFRRFLQLLGISQWRGWPNDPAFRRKCHRPDWLVNRLEQIGYVVDGSRGSPRQTWVRATKPAKVAGTRDC